MYQYHFNELRVGLWRKVRAYVSGVYEFRHAFTGRYAVRELNQAYDAGRELAHLCTFRRFDL